MKVGVVGATGAVGRELLSILDERDFPVTDLALFASARSQGKTVSYREKSYRIQVLKDGCFKGLDIVYFDASDAVSKEWVPQAAASGAWVVDNSGAFRMEPGIPLIVPEVNPQALGETDGKIIAGPNCSTVALVVALKPLHDRFGLKRVVVSTFQSVSGAGSAAMEELSGQTVAMFNQRELVPKVFPHQIAFNCIPQIGGVAEDGTTSEERKIIAEARKILGLPRLKITATAIRVPTFSCHGESVNIEFERTPTIEEAREALSRFPGIVLQDDAAKGVYPMNVPSTGKDPVYVGRLRIDESVENGLNLWLVSDNLRKGAALNAIQIGELLSQR